MKQNIWQKLTNYTSETSFKQVREDLVKKFEFCYVILNGHPYKINMVSDDKNDFVALIHTDGFVRLLPWECYEDIKIEFPTRSIFLIGDLPCLIRRNHQVQYKLAPCKENVSAFYLPKFVKLSVTLEVYADWLINKNKDYNDIQLSKNVYINKNKNKTFFYLNKIPVAELKDKNILAFGTEFLPEIKDALRSFHEYEIKVI